MKKKHKPAAETEVSAELMQPKEPWLLWTASFIVAAALFVGSALFAVQRTLTGVQLHLFRLINDWPEQLKPAFLAATIVPHSLWMAVAAVLVTFALKLYRLAWQLAAATVAGFVIAFLAKHFIARPRPGILLNDVHVRVHEADMGFPSGHTMIITVIVLILFPYLPRGWRWGAVFLIPLMALSRIYLGVHSPIDVAGGFAVGLGVVSAMHLLPSRARIFLRFD